MVGGEILRYPYALLGFETVLCDKSFIICN